MSKIASSKGDSNKKENERRKAFNKLVRTVDNQLDYTWCRSANFKQLRFDDQVEEDSNFQCDTLFHNSDPGMAFNAFRFYEFGSDLAPRESTILLLARADAFFTSNLTYSDKLLNRGGNRFERYGDDYQKMLLEAIQSLMSLSFDILRRAHPEELLVHPVSDSVTSSNKFLIPRKGSCIFLMPSTGNLVLAILPSFFSKHISQRLGDVMDCFVGTTSHNGDQFSVNVPRRKHHLLRKQYVVLMLLNHLNSQLSLLSGVKKKKVPTKLTTLPISRPRCP